MLELPSLTYTHTHTHTYIFILNQASSICLTHSRSLSSALSGQFTEDGSFIGQYVPGKLQPPVSPQPLNNTTLAHQPSPSQPATGVAAGAGSSGASGGGGGVGGGTSSAANTAAVATYV